MVVPHPVASCVLLVSAPRRAMLPRDGTGLPPTGHQTRPWPRDGAGWLLREQFLLGQTEQPPPRPCSVKYSEAAAPTDAGMETLWIRIRIWLRAGYPRDYAGSPATIRDHESREQVGLQARATMTPWLRRSYTEERVCRGAHPRNARAFPGFAQQAQPRTVPRAPSALPEAPLRSCRLR